MEVWLAVSVLLNIVLLVAWLYADDKVSEYIGRCNWLQILLDSANRRIKNFEKTIYIPKPPTGVVECEHHILSKQVIPTEFNYGSSSHPWTQPSYDEDDRPHPQQRGPSSTD